MGKPYKLDADEMLAQESGARSPAGLMATLIATVALCWSLFQLWIASPLPFMLKWGY